MCSTFFPATHQSFERMMSANPTKNGWTLAHVACQAIGMAGMACGLILRLIVHCILQSKLIDPHISVYCHF